MFWFVGLLGACSPSPGGESGGNGVEIRLGTAGMESVLLAEWETETARADRLLVRFGDESFEIVESTPKTAHRVPLVGVPANTEVRVEFIQEGAAVAEAVGATGALPAWVPRLEVNAELSGRVEPGLTAVVIASGGGKAGGVLLLDAAARVVWSYAAEDAGVDLAFRARLSLDGQAVLFNTLAPDAVQPGPIHRVSLIDGSLETLSVRGGHVDFVEPEPGVVASLGWDIREVEGRLILGDTLIERATDGTERVIWNVWDHFSPDLSVSWPTLYIADPTVEDWSHVNGLSYAADEDAFYLSMTFIEGVARIDRASGTMSWVLAQSEGDLVPEDAGALSYPHSAERLADGGLLVFNRGVATERDQPAFVTEFSLDEAGGSAATRWQYRDPEGVWVNNFGSAQRLPGGNTFVCWGSAGLLDEITPEGEIASRVAAPVGMAFGFASRHTPLTW